MKRFAFVLICFGLELVFFLVLALYSAEAATSIFWTALNGETSYLAWHAFFGFHPLRGYLAAVLSIATLQLLAVWFVVFSGSKPSLDHPWVKRIFNEERLRERFPAISLRAGEASRSFIFFMGLVPGIWWFGFLALRQNPMRWGVMTVALGNIVKLFVFAFVFSLGESRFVAYLVIGAIVIASFLPRLVEKLIAASPVTRYRPL